MFLIKETGAISLKPDPISVISAKIVMLDCMLGFRKSQHKLIFSNVCIPHINPPAQ